VTPDGRNLSEDQGSHHTQKIIAGYGRFWPIATGDALTANRRFRGIADMDRFSSRNDL